MAQHDEALIELWKGTVGPNDDVWQLRLGVRPDGDSFVVAKVDGQPLQPRSLTHEGVRVLGKTCLPRIRFHDLRHTHATQMLSAGAHPKIAS